MARAGTLGLHLERAGQELGFPGLALGPDHALDLILAGGLHLGFRHDPDRDLLRLHSQLFEQPDLLPASMLATMLEANFLWLGSEGGVLAVRDGSVVLLRQLALGELSYDELKLALERFLDVAEHYGRACAAAAEAPAAMPAPPRRAASAEPSPWQMIRG